MPKIEYTKEKCRRMALEESGDGNCGAGILALNPQDTKPCPHCERGRIYGHGPDYAHHVKCKHCDGLGYIIQTDEDNADTSGNL